MFRSDHRLKEQGKKKEKMEESRSVGSRPLGVSPAYVIDDLHEVGRNWLIGASCSSILLRLLMAKVARHKTRSCCEAGTFWDKHARYGVIVFGGLHMNRVAPH